MSGPAAREPDGVILKVFISHVRSSALWSEWIASTLRQAGHEIYDSWDLLPGANFVQFIETALNSAEITIVIADAKYFDSTFAQAEWQASLVRSADSVLVLRVEPVRIPGLLSAVRSVNLFDRNEDEARELLLASVSAYPLKPYGAQSSSDFPGGSGIVSERETQTTISDTSDNLVFISYSHKDHRWLDRLLIHLKPLERLGVLDVWSDRRISPGLVWKQEIENALNRAKAAILLISADFLASDFVVEYELPTLLATVESKGTSILPLIVAPSRFVKHEELSRFQAFNSPGVPLSKMTVYAREELLVLLVDRIEEILTG